MKHTESAFTTKCINSKKKQSYRNYTSPFGATLRMFEEFIGYTEPLSYDEWMAAPEDHKVAILYVQFYDQISLAWYKLRTDAAIEEECVEEVIQYLMKNVAFLKSHPDRFKPGYIYRICYNCIYCKSIDPYKGQTAKTSWYNNTSSPYIVTGEGEELSVFDTIDGGEDADEVLASENFWKIIEDMGDETLSVVSKLLGDGYIPGQRVNKKRSAEIVEELKVALAPFAPLYYGD